MKLGPTSTDLTRAPGPCRPPLTTQVPCADWPLMLNAPNAPSWVVRGAPSRSATLACGGADGGAKCAHASCGGLLPTERGRPLGACHHHPELALLQPTSTPTPRAACIQCRPALSPGPTDPHVGSSRTTHVFGNARAPRPARPAEGWAGSPGPRGPGAAPVMQEVMCERHHVVSVSVRVM